MRFNAMLLSLLVPLAGYSLSLEDRVTDLEKKMAQTSTITEMGNRGAQNANAYPENTSTGFHVQAGFSYLHAAVEGTQFASKDNATYNDLITQVSTLTHDVVEQDIGWNWGFEAGAGYLIPDYNWDIDLNYAYYTNSASSKVAGGSNGLVTPIRAFALLTPSDQFLECAQASSSFNISSNLIDLTLGSSFFTSRYFVMKLLTGLRSHWLDLKQDITYSGGDYLGANDWRVNARSDFWGMGPVGGFDTQWHLCRNVSILSNLRLGYLYGQYKVTNNQDNTYDDVHDRNSFGLHQGMVELGALLGLSWGQYFNDRNQFLSFTLAYQFDYLWGANQMAATGNNYPISVPTTVDGNVTLHGLVGGIRFDF